jgi:acyl carrier protein
MTVQRELQTSTPQASVSAEIKFAPSKYQNELGTFGRYRVLKKLGQGGMGAVYLAYDEALERKIAMKVLLPQFAADSAARERFKREARAVAKVKSDHVVTIHEVGEVQDTPFIAMEYLLGSPLDEYLKERGRLALSQTLRIVRETAIGLAAAHALNLVHRDIKPGNLWLEAPRGRVKLLDFGLARIQNDQIHLTNSGAIIGTPAYMSPEQARGQKVDHRSDLFSLGVMLYQLCTGKMPFAGDSVLAVLTSLAVDTPIPPQQLNPDIPPALEAAIDRLLAKDPANRFQTAQQVMESLHEIKPPKAVAGAAPASAPITGSKNRIEKPLLPLPEVQSEPTGEIPKPPKPLSHEPKSKTVGMGTRVKSKTEQLATPGQAPSQSRVIADNRARTALATWWPMIPIAIVVLIGGAVAAVKFTAPRPRSASPIDSETSDAHGSTSGQETVPGVASAPPAKASVSPKDSPLWKEEQDCRKAISIGNGSVSYLKKHGLTRYADWKARADAGDPVGQWFVARCYQEGIVTPRDEKIAFEWLKKAAAQNYDLATYTMAHTYRNGTGVTKDPAQALSWYTKAANMGLSLANAQLGHLYAGSELGKSNPKLAFEHFRKAAEMGDAQTMRITGNCYKNGTGTAKDPAQAKEWYDKAANAGDAWTVGTRLGDKMAAHFAKYLDATAPQREKDNALSALRGLKAEYDRCSLVSLEAIWSSQLANSRDALNDLPSSDPLRSFNVTLIDQYAVNFSDGAVNEREASLTSFALAINQTSRTQEKYKDRKYDDIVSFWDKHYAGIHLSKLGSNVEADAIVTQWRFSLCSLIRVGKRKEAESAQKDVLDFCERILEDSPWDYYIKDAYRILCFEVAKTWEEIGNSDQVQPLLKRGWSWEMRRWGREDMLARYRTLPLLGSVPDDAKGDDREIFECFKSYSEDEKNVEAKVKENREKMCKKWRIREGMKRFTVPCDFDGVKFPFHVYVSHGKPGYSELLDQFRWLEERRGGKMPVEVKDSFGRLNTIAKDNKVDFADLCVYALGAAADEDVERDIRQIISKHFKVAADKIDKTKPLSTSANLNGLDEVEFVMALEEKFNISIPNSKSSGIRNMTLEQVVKLVKESKPPPKKK